MEDGFLNEIASIVNENVTEFEQDEMAYNCMELCGTTKTVTSDEYISKLVLTRNMFSSDFCKEEFEFNDLRIKYKEDGNLFVVEPDGNFLRGKVEKRFDSDSLKYDECFEKFFDFCYNWKKKVLLQVEVDSYTDGCLIEWMTMEEFEKLYNYLKECGDYLLAASESNCIYGVSYTEKNGHPSFYISSTIISIKGISVLD